MNLQLHPAPAARRCALASLFVFCALPVFSAWGASISVTGGVSGGNPGGQPLYQVTGLVAGDAFNLSWGGVNGLDVEGMLTVASISATELELRLMLDNLSAPLSMSDPRVTSFGVAASGATGVASSVTGGSHLDLGDDSNFPGFTIDGCATSGNNCGGGGSGGIPAGSSDDLTLVLAGNFGASVDLSVFALKIQGGPGGDSFELAGVPSPKIPEPTSMGLLALALSAGVFGLRRSV